ncbi:hypothetical protein V8E53_003704 [Lactarius tabidus]
MPCELPRYMQCLRGGELVKETLVLGLELEMDHIGKLSGHMTEHLGKGGDPKANGSHEDTWTYCAIDEVGELHDLKVNNLIQLRAVDPGNKILQILASALEPKVWRDVTNRNPMRKVSSLGKCGQRRDRRLWGNVPSRGNIIEIEFDEVSGRQEAWVMLDGECRIRSSQEFGGKNQYIMIPRRNVEIGQQRKWLLHRCDYICQLRAKSVTPLKCKRTYTIGVLKCSNDVFFISKSDLHTEGWPDTQMLLDRSSVCAANLEIETVW